jgi:CRISPR-associated endonuclease Csn1
LHNDTAYGFTGQMAPDGRVPIVVHRVPLLSLKTGDISSSDRIRDVPLRKALHAATRGETEKTLPGALTRFSRSHPHFRGIRGLRVCEPLTLVPIRDDAGRVYKGYKGDANARYDVWRLPDGKWVPDVVPLFDAHQREAPDRRPHPAAKKVLSLRQNDMLVLEHDGRMRCARVVKFSTNGQLVVADAHEAGALKARDASRDDPFKYIYMSASSLKRARARQIRVDALGRVGDPGPRD